MPTIKLPREEALELLDNPVWDYIVATRRWSVVHGVIVKIGDKLYRANYSVGATESQDESPWEYDKEVTFTEVEEYQRTITSYKTVKESDAAQEGK